MQCAICGRSGSDVKENTSSLYKKSILYCLDCLVSGREPYDDLVSYGWEYTRFTKSYRQKIILPTLAFYKKTIEQFNEDVVKKRDEIINENNE